MKADLSARDNAHPKKQSSNKPFALPTVFFGRPQHEFAGIFLFVEDYCTRVPEPIQTRIGANQERRWRKVLDDTLINLRDHICRLTRCVIVFQ
jgi:hypothetical protein